jgi:hypothetical protein
VAFQSLALAPQTPVAVREFIAECVENLFFKDVHTMLRLPQPEHGFAAGCNFAIAHTLLASIGGVSATLYAHEGRSGELFRGLLRDCYPWSREPGSKVKPEAAATYLYNLFRNPLTHSLGLLTENIPASTRRYVKPRKYVVKVKRLNPDGHGLGKAMIAELEQSSYRPTMSATLTLEPERKVLLVEALYWGTRCMIETLTHDSARMQAADEFLRRHV